MSRRLLIEGKKEESGSIQPGTLPSMDEPLPGDSTALARRVKSLQSFLLQANQKFLKARKAMGGIPLPPERAGETPSVHGSSLLLDDFEGKGVNGVGFAWKRSVHSKGLGTSLKKDPSGLSKGGCPESPGFAARLQGRYNQRFPPWPKAELKCPLAGDGKSLSLEGFNAVRFWAKGDGGSYSVSLERSRTADGAHPQALFLADSEWRRITVFFSSLRQPRWGRAVPPKCHDVLALSFSPVHGVKASGFDLRVDQIEFVRATEPKSE